MKFSRPRWARPVGWAFGVMLAYLVVLVVGTMLERHSVSLPLSPLTVVLSLAGGVASGFLYHVLAPLRRTSIVGYRLTWVFSAAVFGAALVPLIGVTDPIAWMDIPKWVAHLIGAAVGGLMGLAMALGGEKYRAFDDLELEDADDVAEQYSRAIEEERAFLRQRAGYDRSAADMLAAADKDELSAHHVEFLERVAARLGQKAGQDRITRAALHIAQTTLESVRTDAQRLATDPSFADEVRRRDADLDVEVAAELEKEAQELRDKALTDPETASRLAALQKAVMELRGKSARRSIP